MFHRKLIGAGLAAAFCLVGVTPAVAGGGGGDRTLAEILLADSDRDDENGFDHRFWDYDIVTQAVLLFPDLVDAASNPDAELTVFLPNDFAFKRLVKDLSGDWPGSELETFEAVASLGTDTVRTVLTYHIVAGPPISYRQALRSDGAELTTLQGGAFTVDVKRLFFFKLVFLRDLDPDDRDPLVVQGNVGGEASNGFAHGIHRVLRPVDL